MIDYLISDPVEQIWINLELYFKIYKFFKFLQIFLEFFWIYLDLFWIKNIFQNIFYIAADVAWTITCCHVSMYVHAMWRTRVRGCGRVFVCVIRRLSIH